MKAEKRREIGLLFKPEMVRAAWRAADDPLHKLVTRRVSAFWSRVEPGSLLWVREPWRTFETDVMRDGARLPCVDGVLFQADGAFHAIENTEAAADRWIDAHANGKHGDKWRPGIHMPRWACRMHLEVVSVRPEPGFRTLTMRWGDDREMLPGVSDAEARLEGVENRDAYIALWQKINGSGWPPATLYRVEFRELWRAAPEVCPA